MRFTEPIAELLAQGSLSAKVSTQRLTAVTKPVRRGTRSSLTLEFDFRVRLCYTYTNNLERGRKMEGLTLTRRGKVVLGIFIVGIALVVNIFLSGKWVECDLRGQADRCSIESVES